MVSRVGEGRRCLAARRPTTCQIGAGFIMFLFFFRYFFLVFFRRPICQIGAGFINVLDVFSSCPLFSFGLVFLNFCKLLGKWKPSTPLMVSTFQAVHQLNRRSHYTNVIWWPNLQLMQLWCHLVAKFVTNASGVVWWPNLQLILVAPSGGQICNKCNYGAIWWPSDHEVCFSTDHVCISSLVLGIFVF